MGKWWRELWQSARRAPRADVAYRVAMALALLLGVGLRLNGYLSESSSFWFDEALWGNRLLRQPLLSLGIRPLGFMGLTWLLIQVFGATEAVFRCLPMLGALASLLLMPYVASRLLSSRPLRVLMVLLFALHPALIDYAKEFKPYSFEVLVHLLPIAIYLRYQQTQRAAYLYGLLALLPVAFLFAYNMAFAFPGLLLLCALHALRPRRKLGLLAACLASGVVCAAAALTIYSLSLSKVTKEERTESYWGRKYDVFYRPDEGTSRVAWTIEKYDDMSALIGSRRVLWTEPGGLSESRAATLGAVERSLWIGLSFFGLVYIGWKRRELALALLLPLLCVIAVNAVGKWPLGAFRTNMFACVYLFPLPFLGLTLLSGLSRLGEKALIAAIVLLTLLPGFAFGFDWHGHKRTWTRDHYQRQVIELLYRYRLQHLAEDPKRPPELLLMDAHTYHSHDYYLSFHPEFHAKYQAFFKKNFVLDKEGGSAQSLVAKARRRLASARQPIWVVASKRDGIDALAKFSRKQAKVLVSERLGGQHLIQLLSDD